MTARKEQNNVSTRSVINFKLKPRFSQGKVRHVNMRDEMLGKLHIGRPLSEISSEVPSAAPPVRAEISYAVKTYWQPFMSYEKSICLSSSNEPLLSPS